MPENATKIAIHVLPRILSLRFSGNYEVNDSKFIEVLKKYCVDTNNDH